LKRRATACCCSNPGTRKITDVNPFMIEFLGYTHEEFVGKELWEIGLFKDQQASRKMFRELREKRFIRYEDLPLKSTTGRTREVGVVANLYEEDTHPVIQCNIRDITDRKAIEEQVRVSEIRYRRLFEAARDGVLLLNPGTRKITDVNPFMIEFLGYTHEEFVGKELWEIGLLRDEQASQEAFRELNEQGLIRYEDLPLETKLGERREVEFVSNRSTDNGHTVIQCNIRDITERKRAEQELVAAKNEISRHPSRWRKRSRNARPSFAKRSANWRRSRTASPMICARRGGPCGDSPRFLRRRIRPNSTRKESSIWKKSRPRRAAWTP
jgi:PAS domain S-box-containing protein